MELVGHANVQDWRGFERSLGLTEMASSDGYLIAFPGMSRCRASDEIIEECYTKLLKVRKTTLSGLEPIGPELVENVTLRALPTQPA
jgi:hypothetical protein